MRKNAEAATGDGASRRIRTGHASHEEVEIAADVLVVVVATPHAQLQMPVQCDGVEQRLQRIAAGRHLPGEPRAGEMPRRRGFDDIGLVVDDKPARIGSVCGVLRSIRMRTEYEIDRPSEDAGDLFKELPALLASPVQMMAEPLADGLDLRRCETGLIEGR